MKKGGEDFFTKPVEPTLTMWPAHQKFAVVKCQWLLKMAPICALEVLIGI